MNKTKIVFCLALIFTFLNLSIPYASSYDDEYSRETLKGLKGVHVIVHVLKPEIERTGLTKAQIQTDVELKLRMAGIKVFSGEEWVKDPSVPYLEVQPTVNLNSSISLFLYHINVNLVQQAFSIRDLKIVACGITWDTDALGITPDPQNIRNDIKNQIDIFINAYLSVNPK